MMYIVQSQVVTVDGNGFSCSRQIPTFFLDSDVQGIVSVEHAQRIVKDILNPADDVDTLIYSDIREVNHVRSDV